MSTSPFISILSIYLMTTLRWVKHVRHLSNFCFHSPAVHRLKSTCRWMKNKHKHLMTMTQCFLLSGGPVYLCYLHNGDFTVKSKNVSRWQQAKAAACWQDWHSMHQDDDDDKACLLLHVHLAAGRFFYMHIPHVGKEFLLSKQAV